VIAVAFAGAGAVSVLVASAIPPVAAVIVLLGLIGFGSGVAALRATCWYAPPRRRTRPACIRRGLLRLDIGLSGAPLMFGMLMDAHHPGWYSSASARFRRCR